jgi:site-specific DNA-adenine methylase
VVVREWTHDVFVGGGAIFQNLDSDVRIEFSDLSRNREVVAMDLEFVKAARVGCVPAR